MRLKYIVVLSAACATWASAALAAAQDDHSPVIPTSGSDEIRVAIRNTIFHVRNLRDEYAAKTDEKRKIQAGFDSSIIALGIAAVGAALYRASNTSIGAIGLGAAGLSAYRSYYAPDVVGAAYGAATAAARCVASTAEPLLTDQPEPLWAEIQNLNQAIANVNASNARLPAGAPGGAEGSNAAQQAVSSAQAAMMSLLAEAKAYNDEPSTIDKAHDVIKNYMDKARHRSTQDFSALRENLNAAVTKASTTSQAGQVSAATQLPAAAQSQAQAQIAAHTSGSAPAPLAGSPPPASLAEATAPVSAQAETVGPDPNKAATRAVQRNAMNVAALNAATGHALLLLTNVEFSTVANQVSQCVSGLS